MENYFFKNEKMYIPHIENEIGEMAGVIFYKDKIIYKCEYCKESKADVRIKYYVIRHYPHESYPTDIYKDQRVCKYCAEEIRMTHKVIPGLYDPKINQWWWKNGGRGKERTYQWWWKKL